MAARSTPAIRFSCEPGPKCATTTPPALLPNAQPLPNADSNRMVDTGAIASDNEYLTGLEFLYIRGPFSFQAEYGWNWVDNAVGVVHRRHSFEPFATPQNYVFNGGYVQLAYTLTGENRAYDRRMGTLAREYYGKPGPYEQRLDRPR